MGGWEGAEEGGKGRSCCTLYTGLGTLEFILGAVGRSSWICRGGEYQEPIYISAGWPMKTGKNRLGRLRHGNWEPSYLGD